MSRSRAPNGVGTVFQEAGRGWCAECYVTLPDGRRKRARGRGASPEAAVRARTAAVQRLMEGNPEASRLTVRALSERWLNAAANRMWAAETKRSYETALRLHILPKLGDARASLVTGFDVQRVLDSIPHASVANRCRRTMHAMFQQAVRWGVVKANPVAGTAPISPPRNKEAWWTRGEAAAFLECAKSTPYGLVFRVLITTGLRVGELIALTWGDVRGGELRVRRTFSQSTRGRIQAYTKNRAERRVPLPPDVLDDLEARRGADDELVFRGERGGLLNPSVIRRSFIDACIRCDARVIRVHDLRRTYASLLAEAGYHPSVIQRLLGHSSPDLALKVYTSVADSTLAGAVVNIGGHPGGGVPASGDAPVRPGGASGSESESGIAEETPRAPVAQLDRAGDS